jgi:hypothetical protein
MSGAFPDDFVVGRAATTVLTGFECAASWFNTRR